MTYEEWMTSGDPRQMLDLIRSTVESALLRTDGGNHTVFDVFQCSQWEPHERKCRLIACAFSRSVWGLLSDELSRAAVEVAELEADGLASNKDLDAAWQDAVHACDKIEGSTGSNPSARWHAARACAVTAWCSFRPGGNPDPDLYGYSPAFYAATSACIATAEARGFLDGGNDPIHLRISVQQINAEIIRDAYGPLLFPKLLDPNWKREIPESVLRMAGETYSRRDFRLLPAIADLLEEAGFSEPTVITHCRQQGRHYPGCWVIDDLLGKFK